MTQTRIQKTKSELGKIFAVGILIFTVIIGSITAFAIFLANVKLT